MDFSKKKKSKTNVGSLFDNIGIGNLFFNITEERIREYNETEAKHIKHGHLPKSLTH